MNSKDAIERIKKLLFGQESFGTHKTKEGVEMTVEGDVELGKEIYIVTPDGNIPAAEGDYEMEDGMKVKVVEGLIDAIDYEAGYEDKEEEMEAEVEVTEEEETTMVSAELIDGTLVETDTEELKVGDALFVVTEEGRTEAPDGDHETTDGKIVSVVDGVVTEIKDKVEKVVEEELTTEETESFDELLEVFTAGFNHLSSELNVMREEYDKLREDFSKFSAEPAGERLYFNTQDYAKELKTKKHSKLEALRALKNK